MWRANIRATDIVQLKVTTSSDPSTNAAVSTDIIDGFSGVVITTTGVSNSQTLQSPTNTSPIKRFSVINNDTSTHAITVNGVSLAVWSFRSFMWDGDAWCW